MCVGFEVKKGWLTKLEVCGVNGREVGITLNYEEVPVRY